MFAFRSIIVMTTQFMSPALHKNFSEADFDFKVCSIQETHHKATECPTLFHNSVSDTQWFNIAFTDLCLCLRGVLGVELLFQPHRTVHQPAQPAAGGARPG